MPTARQSTDARPSILVVMLSLVATGTLALVTEASRPLRIQRMVQCNWTIPAPGWMLLVGAAAVAALAVAVVLALVREIRDRHWLLVVGLTAMAATLLAGALQDDVSAPRPPWLGMSRAAFDTIQDVVVVLLLTGPLVAFVAVLMHCLRKVDILGVVTVVSTLAYGTISFADAKVMPPIVTEQASWFAWAGSWAVWVPVVLGVLVVWSTVKVWRTGSLDTAITVIVVTLPLTVLLLHQSLRILPAPWIQCGG
ncbi:MAG: hypothetical protein Q4G45_13895 [Actinomycetia bacterium]|nr:hypothetical protein [Actinomycetes bacterium]